MHVLPTWPGSSGVGQLVAPHSPPADAKPATGHRPILGPVRHATEEDLDQLEPLLAELRTMPLSERKRGSFSRGSNAFLHFHADEGEYWVDVRLGEGFERMPVTTQAERDSFLGEVRKALGT